MRLEATKFPSSLFRPYLQTYGLDSEKETFAEETVPWRFNNTPLVRVEFSGRSGRGLESVGCGDLIVVFVLDVIAVAVASNSFLLRWPFVEGKWRVSLAWDDG